MYRFFLEKLSLFFWFGRKVSTHGILLASVSGLVFCKIPPFHCTHVHRNTVKIELFLSPSLCAKMVQQWLRIFWLMLVLQWLGLIFWETLMVKWLRNICFQSSIYKKKVNWDSEQTVFKDQSNFDWTAPKHNTGRFFSLVP